MKKTWIGTVVVLAGSALTLAAQSAGPGNPQALGRGRGGAPFAWNDRNRDGICDITGRPVGQPGGGMAAMGQAWGRGRGGAPHAWNDKNGDGICDITGQPVGQGRAAGGMRGRGAGRGFGRGFAARQAARGPAN